MKRIPIFLLFAIIMCFCVPTVAFGEKECKYNETGCKVCETVKNIDKVQDCKAVVIKGNAFIAVKLGGIATKSTAQKVEQTIKETIKTDFPCITQVYVSTSVKAFSAMDSFEKGVKLDQILQMFDVDIRELFPPRDVEGVKNTTCLAMSNLQPNENEQADEQTTQEETDSKISKQDKAQDDAENGCKLKEKIKKLPFGLKRQSRPQALPKWKPEN